MVFITRTLADAVLKDFSRIRLKKVTVKVPKLKIRKKKVLKPKKEDKIPISSIVDILIKSAVEKARREKKEKAVEEAISYKILKDERKLTFNDGYGTISKSYGATPHTSYVNYEKLFNYLGKFKSQSTYENMAEHDGVLNKTTESGGFTLVNRETMDRGAWYVKYVAGSQDINTLSLVPKAGMSSAEWEQFKLWMKLDPVMYRLKTSTS